MQDTKLVPSGSTRPEPARPPKNSPWSFEAVSPVSRRAQSVLWNPRFLKEAFDRRAPYTFRSGGTEADEAVVLADIFIMDEETFSIEAQLLRFSARSERYTLRVRLITETRAGGRPRATLRWGSKTYTRYMSGGTAVFPDLDPISDLQARINDPSHDFGLTIDFDDQSPPRSKKQP